MTVQEVAATFTTRTGVPFTITDEQQNPQGLTTSWKGTVSPGNGKPDIIVSWNPNSGLAFLPVRDYDLVKDVPVVFL